MLVQGTTTWIPLRENARLEPGESVVVHAAAGGVGTIAVQLAKADARDAHLALRSRGTVGKLLLDPAR